MKEEAFERFMKKWQAAHQGAGNAYRTVFLGGGADVNVVGRIFKDLDFKTVQGAGEPESRRRRVFTRSLSDCLRVSRVRR